MPYFLRISGLSVAESEIGCLHRFALIAQILSFRFLHCLSVRSQFFLCVPGLVPFFQIVARYPQIFPLLPENLHQFRSKKHGLRLQCLRLIISRHYRFQFIGKIILHGNLPQSPVHVYLHFILHRVRFLNLAIRPQRIRFFTHMPPKAGTNIGQQKNKQKKAAGISFVCSF